MMNKRLTRKFVTGARFEVFAAMKIRGVLVCDAMKCCGNT